MGHAVLGSDTANTAMTEAVKQRGGKISQDQSGGFLQEANEAGNIDWFVHSSAIGPDHLELLRADQLGLKISKRDELLNYLIKDKRLKLIAITGTHGKTTTTGLVIWLMKQLSQPVSYSIGTEISFGDSGHYEAGSQYFVYEADEFDRNFLGFQPLIGIITSIDYDHPDTYKTIDDYRSAFAEFISRCHCVFMWSQDKEVIEPVPAGVVHALSSSDDLGQINLPGHNQLNAYLAFRAVQSLLPKIPDKTLLEAINRFPGTGRRFEQLKPGLYTDYAHHPVEIQSTIELAKNHNSNVVVVYQPHQNLRQHYLAQNQAYKTCFNNAKWVYWLPTYLSREDPAGEPIAPAELIKGLENPTTVTVVNLDEELKRRIDVHLQAGDLVLLMSAGDLDGWARKNFRP